MTYGPMHGTKSAFCAVLAVLFVISGGLDPAAAQSSKVFELKLQSVDQPSNIGPAEILPAWTKLLDQMSGGRLKVSVFTAGQIVPTGEIVNALERGIIDMAYTNPVYYTGSIPEGFLMSTSIPPSLVDNTDDAKELWWFKGLDELMRQAYLERGVYYLGTLWVGEPVAHWSRKPMKDLSEINGYKVRGFGYISKTFEKLGAAPVSLAMNEVYTALAQGAIDGSMTQATYYEQSKLFEVAPYFYSDPLLTSSSMCMMVSKKIWDELPDDLKAILQVANRWYSDQFEIRNRMEYKKMLKKFPQMGVTAISWPKEDLRVFKKTAASFLPEVAAKGPRVEKGIKIIEDYLKSKQ